MRFWWFESTRMAAIFAGNDALFLALANGSGRDPESGYSGG
jgi:hypothetical protein